MVDCIKCGEDFSQKRYDLGFKTCLSCGDIEAKKHKFTIVPMHKSNYVPVFRKEDLQGINNKGCQVK